MSCTRLTASRARPSATSRVTSSCLACSDAATRWTLFDSASGACGRCSSSSATPEDAADAEAKQGGKTTATTLPTQGGGGDQVASAAPKSSGGGGQPYIIPANDYARPRFGLTSEIFNEPVSIA